MNDLGWIYACGWVIILGGGFGAIIIYSIITQATHNNKKEHDDNWDYWD